MPVLNHAEKEAVFEVIEQLLHVRSKRALLFCINRDLRKLLMHDSFVCGFGRFRTEGLEPRFMLSHEFPERYLDSISVHGRIRPQTLRFWAQANRPLALNFAEIEEDSSAEGDTTVPSLQMVRSARRFGFYNMLCHGQVDIDRRHMSYVSFNRISDAVSERHRTIASHIMPHMHNCLLRLSEEDGMVPAPLQIEDLVEPDDGAGDCVLTLRQQQILYLLSLGKTNWEIGQILGTSVNNVKYHIKRLNTLFGANSRTATISVATQMGLVPSDWPGQIGYARIA